MLVVCCVGFVESQPLGIFGSTGPVFDAQENLNGGSIVDRPPRSRQPVVISLPKSTSVTDHLDNNIDPDQFPPAFSNFTYNNNNNSYPVDTFQGLNNFFFC